MIPAVERHVLDSWPRYFTSEPLAVSSLVLTQSRHKGCEAGRIVQMLFAGEAKTPAVVARFGRRPGRSVPLEREFEVVRTMAGAGLAPEPLGIELVAGTSVLFERFEGGEKLSSQLVAAGRRAGDEGIRQSLNHLFKQAGDFLARLHAVQVPSNASRSVYPMPSEAAETYIADFLTDRIQALAIRDLVGDEPVALVWQHGDFIPSNVVDSGGQTRALDWEFGGIHEDRYFDAMRFSYYSFVTALHLGLFAGRDFLGSYYDVFLDRRHWLSDQIRRLLSRMAGREVDDRTYFRSLLLCEIQDVLLQRRVSLVFEPEDRTFHRRIVGAILGYEQYLRDSASARASAVTAEARVAELEAERDSALASAAASADRLAEVDAELEAAAARVSELESTRAALDETRVALEDVGRRAETLQASLSEAETRAHQLGERLRRIDARLVVRAYRAIKRIYRRFRDALTLLRPRAPEGR